MLSHLVRFWEVCCTKNFSALPETKDLEENDQPTRLERNDDHSWT